MVPWRWQFNTDNHTKTASKSMYSTNPSGINPGWAKEEICRGSRTVQEERKENHWNGPYWHEQFAVSCKTFVVIKGKRHTPPLIEVQNKECCWLVQIVLGSTVFWVIVYLQGCLASKQCSAQSSLNCRYLNPYIKLKLTELAIQLYQRF